MKVIPLYPEPFVISCPECGSTEFYIEVDQPEYTAITGFVCVECDSRIEVYLLCNLINGD